MSTAADSRSPHRLYRWFDDEQVVLYIGQSARLAMRESAHIDSAEWMNFASGSTIQRYETLEALVDAEREAIKAEHPIFNKQNNNTPEAKERLRAYLEQAGRLDLLQPGPRMIQQRRPRLTAPRNCLNMHDTGLRALDATALATAVTSVARHRNIGMEDVAAETGVPRSMLGGLSRGQKPDADALVTLLAWLNADAAAFAVPRAADAAHEKREEHRR